MAFEEPAGAPYLSDRQRFGDIALLKFSPSFYASFVPRGGVLSYETGAGINPWSLHFTLKYFSGVDSSESLDPIDRHVKIELHPRFWVRDFLNEFFFSPVISVYNTGDIAGGIVFGAQYYLTDWMLFDAYTGIQSTTPVEHFKSGIFLRFGLNLGFQIR